MDADADDLRSLSYKLQSTHPRGCDFLNACLNDVFNVASIHTPARV